MLRNLLTTSFSPEHDVAGVTDPFLQTKILRFLRLLGRDSVEVSESINDILAQVATNTDSSKTVGNSILYECVLTILEIRADSALRVMAINILGKFLGNHDNNIRYVALNTLNKVVSIDTNAVQRHRSTILECLRDADISIRRRALELTYTLINESTVQALMRELLQFLEVADNEFKLTLTTRICIAAERYAPNKQWHMDTMLQVLRLAGNYIREDVLASFLLLVCHTPELQEYAVKHLYAALHADMSQASQTLAAVWVMGEYSDVLLEMGRITVDGVTHDVSPEAVVDLLASLLDSVYATENTREYVLTTLAKLHTRMHDKVQQARIVSILQHYEKSIDVEVQKRALEYTALLKRASIRDGVLEVMPLPELRPLVVETVTDAKSSAPAASSALLDMQGTVEEAAAPKQSTNDLLADLFGGESSTTASVPAKPASRSKASHSDILGLFDTPASTSTDVSKTTKAMQNLDLFSEEPAPQQASQPESEAYHRHGLRLAFTVEKTGDSVQVQARFTATDGAAVEGLSLQAAVPKSQQLQMFALSSATVQPGDVATQDMRISGVGAAALRLRIRIAFTVHGEQVRDQVDWTHM